MKASIGRIIDNRLDYLKCKHCGSVNWYENINCHNCENGLEYAKKLTSAFAYRLLKNYKDDEIEIDI